LGLSGRVPPRVDQATKSGLLALLEQATGAGWTFRAACGVLELGEVRAFRWLGRRGGGELKDQAPGGSPMHGLLEEEVAEIVRLFDEWGEVDRSHRKLAHRGSYLERLWVSPASVRRVLAREGLRLRPLPRPGRAVRKPFGLRTRARTQGWPLAPPRSRTGTTGVPDLAWRDPLLPFDHETTAGVTAEDPSLDQPCRPTLVMSCRARTRHTYNGTRRDGRMM
jgi:hypothetical protein